ncbi:thioesterase family protein [Empedobacter stercoris]|uniref:Thioesterase family protein n=2 Tax=Empedobacter TaxID=59734 RepID=A0ABY8VDK0_9FLAO|nr:MULTISPECIES: thioesterase family protein [Empedobacter]MCA4775766.1 thioesterase family protein [Empedobacter stercoris]MCA4782951.1 thioesterase family protein [Empedobacter stercoris]MCA4810476.1 thioesterase family protein [Empedobacter stercoris]NOJ76537.1 thioesterase family protein [Empedobacter stercoris]QNT13434.1 thioesterase family protein [Empedobacter stercoris]
MARLKLILPESFLFSTTIAVRITDLNYGNHLANDKVLSILHEARMQFFQHYGYSELDFAGVSVIMGDVAIEYKNQAFYGDQLLIEISVQDFSRVSFDIAYKISTKDKLIAKAKTGIVTFDYKNNKVVEVPEKIKDIFLNR